jgi:hypothetical protein
MKPVLHFLLWIVLPVLPALAQPASAVRTASFVDATGETPVYYSLESNTPVSTPQAEFGGWDISLQGTTLRVNGGVIMVDSAFVDVTEAPVDGYVYDTPEQAAIPGGSGKGWFNYDPVSHIVTPVENRTFILKLESGRYAKLRVTDYYRQEFTAEGPQPVPRHWSFRFELAPEGSRQFEASR